jgi:molybdate-binding protein/DNA-binding XRE family transcriptional regulator
MPIQNIRNTLRSVRGEHGVGQQELAGRAGISRQTLSKLEAGRSSPSTSVALRLAKVLRCRVEDLFCLEEDTETLRARWAALAEGKTRAGPRNEEQSGSRRKADARRTASLRVAVGFVGGQWVAHSLSAEHPASMCITADGLVRSAPKPRKTAGEPALVQVRPLRSRAALRQNILAIGCDPAIGLLSAWLAERHPDSRLIWLHAPSLSALEVLAQGEAHVAGTHLLDEESRDYNVPFVRSLFPHRSMVVINLARWEEGFVVRSGNPLRIRRVEDLAQANVRFVNREVGAGARRLLDRLLAKAGTPPSTVRGYEHIAGGHLAVAQAVAMRAADVGIATRAAAVAYGLDFVPLAEERSDLVLSQELSSDPRLQRMVDALENRAFRRELASLGGYQVAESGHLVQELRAT